ncbi:MAG: hypothetical protein ACT4QA_19265 [Panacagrimonas sp.]
MFRTAVLSFLWLTLAAGAIPAFADGEKPYQGYAVQLDIVRNGVRLPSPPVTVVGGESARFDMACPHCGILRVHQRVEKFPGTRGERVLVELELFQVRGGRLNRLVAPTLGVWLGEAQSSSFKTDIGVLEIRTRVEGVRKVSLAPLGVGTIPADYSLKAWLRPMVPPRPLI